MHSDLGIGFHPDLGTAGQGLVWGVDHGAWTVNRDPIALGVALTALDGQHGQVGAFGIGADVVLVNVYSAFHFSPSLKSLNAPILSRRLRKPRDSSCRTRGAEIASRSATSCKVSGLSLSSP